MESYRCYLRLRASDGGGDFFDDRVAQHRVDTRAVLRAHSTPQHTGQWIPGCVAGRALQFHDLSLGCLCAEGRVRLERDARGGADSAKPARLVERIHP